MQAKSIKAKTVEELQAALQQSEADGFKPTLAIVFISNPDNAAALQAIFTNNGIVIFGASTFEKFTETGLAAEEIVVLLLDINPACCSIVLKEFTTATPYEAARQVGQAGMLAFKNPGFIITAIDIAMNGEELISGLNDTAGDKATVMGGVAGNPADFSGIVFTNRQSSTGGILALVIDQDKIAIHGVAVSGWKPVGTEKKITKSDGNWIYSIDDEPAMHVIQRFLGNDMFETKAEGLIPSDLGYPLQFKRASGTVIMRPLLLWNTTSKSIMTGGPVKDGAVFRFSLPPDFDVIDKVVESTTIVKKRDLPEVDALLAFSCVGRLGSFGPMIAAEIEGMAATWNKPMAGFFSLGEFGKLEEGPSEFHGTTVSWVALKEKQ